MNKPQAEQRYVTKSGLVYVITNTWTERSWATYQRKPNGRLKRLVSPALPTRSTRAAAQEDFRVFVSHRRWRGSPAQRVEWVPVWEQLLSERLGGQENGERHG
ncbi:MAG: hypothetical protein EPO21_13030 [Chloroflexota bacterium]|nr:MAG: hypothetical protein EPO21_13030 [Chloroflexota bacterium]